MVMPNNPTTRRSLIVLIGIMVALSIIPIIILATSRTQGHGDVGIVGSVSLGILIVGFIESTRAQVIVAGNVKIIDQHYRATGLEMDSARDDVVGWTRMPGA